MPEEFDGVDQYINHGSGSSLDVGSADFCAMCWFRANNPSQVIFSKGHLNPNGNPGWIFRVGPTEILLVAMSDGTGGFDIVDTGVVTDDVWRHAALVRDGGGGLWRLYVDGVEVDTTAIVNASGSLDNSLSDLLIGAVDNNGSPSEFLDGAVDDARVYNRLVTPDEILEIHDMQGKDLIDDGLIFGTRLDDFPPGASASGANSIEDRSGNGNHGTPVNTPTGAEGILSFGRLVA